MGTKLPPGHRFSPKLTDEIRLHIIHMLACYETPSAVKASVKELFDMDVSPALVQSCDPNKSMGLKLAQKWKDIFHAARHDYINDVNRVAIASRNYRLAMLERLAVKAEEAGETYMAAALNKQSAQEMGGAFENRGSGRFGPRGDADDNEPNTIKIAGGLPE